MGTQADLLDATTLGPLLAPRREVRVLQHPGQQVSVQVQSTAGAHVAVLGEVWFFVAVAVTAVVDSSLGAWGCRRGGTQGQGERAETLASPLHLNMDTRAKPCVQHSSSPLVAKGVTWSDQ